MSTAPHRLLAIVTDALEGSEPIEEIRRAGNGSGTSLRIVAPAIEATAFRHTLGDIDEPTREAEERLRVSLDLLGRGGLDATGEVGDPDPVQAAQDALRKEPADEIIIFEREATQTRWFEEDLLERAQASLQPPLRMVVLHTGDPEGEHVVAVEEFGPGTEEPAPGSTVELPISDNAPPIVRGDLAGIAIAVIGTIAAIVLAAATSADSSTETGWAAAAILIAIGISLINMAHVVGLVLFESVRYRGGFATLFRLLSLVGTPAAVLANLLILLFA